MRRDLPQGPFLGNGQVQPELLASQFEDAGKYAMFALIPGSCSEKR
jgi:hypothetical protein